MLFRNRRVKCDEQRPACQKCLSTGRICGGYAIRRGFPGSDPSSGLQIVHHVPGIAQATRMWKIPQSSELIHEVEYRSLEFFQLHTTNCFGPDIGSFLLQAAFYEPIIRTIAVAIGSLHRSFVFHHKGMSATQEDTRFTLIKYGKAIQQLVSIQPHNLPKANDTFLIACILFFSFECLQGHSRSACRHAISGLKIIKQRQLSVSRSHFQTYMPPDAIALLFTILENQILEIEGEQSLDDELRPTLISSFVHPMNTSSGQPSTAERLLDSFQLLYNRFARFCIVCDILYKPQEDRVFDFLAQAQHIRTAYCQIASELKDWTATFDSWIHSPQAQTSVRPSVMLLKVWRVTIGILLRLEWPTSELSWDSYVSDFVDVVAYAADMLCAPANLFTHAPCSISQRHSSTPTPVPPLQSKLLKSPSTVFSVTLGVITPLYMCATRCRDSITRHQAITLLLYCQRREGLWDSEVAGRIATRLVSIEEMAADIEPETEYTPIMIPLSARVYALSPKFDKDRVIRVCYNHLAPLGLVEEVFTW
ncbi:hypothetical protein N7512_008634 [Penicillium capsulatum]|nr:hypothetical protein N7512_008634 [Penicillium capsulatum]